MRVIEWITNLMAPRRRSVRSQPPPGSPPGEGIAVTGGDASKPAYEGVADIDLDPNIREAPKPGKAGVGAP